MEIYLLRHAIAEDAKPGGSDAERALTDTGRQKLQDVLRRCCTAQVSPSLILTSPYVRAVQTAELAAETLGYKKKLVRTDALLPMSSPQQAWEEIRLHKNESQILLAGHEPMLSRCVCYLLGAPTLRVELKKAGTVRVTIDHFGAEPAGILCWMLTPKLAA